MSARSSPSVSLPQTFRRLTPESRNIRWESLTGSTISPNEALIQQFVERSDDHGCSGGNKRL